MPSSNTSRWWRRIWPLGLLRGKCRDRYFRTVARTFATEDGRAILANALRGMLAWRPGECRRVGIPAAAVYPDLGTAERVPPRAQRDDVVIITARFRTGSTLLWNLFRHAPGCTAYYEPLNERRWFDKSARGSQTDPTHRGAIDYWREYDGLAGITPYYREEWTRRNLYMDAAFWDPGMKKCIDILIEQAEGRPVLQFNRIDFRLPWIREHFPNARIIHLYRHPRDQWCSTLEGEVLPPDATLRDFASHDHFYLLTWAADLKYHFPFLEQPPDAHPYRLFYLVWKLSYLFGAAYSDYSLAYERLVHDPRNEVSRLFAHLGWDPFDMSRLVDLVDAPRSGRWRTHADGDWFRSEEAFCETVLREFFGETGVSEAPPPCAGVPEGQTQDRALEAEVPMPGGRPR